MVQVRMPTTASPWQLALLWVDGCNFQRPSISRAGAGVGIAHLALPEVSSWSSASSYMPATIIASKCTDRVYSCTKSRKFLLKTNGPQAACLH